MKSIIKYFLVIVLGLIAYSALSQCTDCVSQWPEGSHSTNSTSLVTLSSCMHGGDYTNFNVTNGQTYTWTTCGDNSFDTQLTLFSGNSCDGPVLEFNDDDCGLQSTITWTATFSGTVTVLLSEYGCNSNATCMTLKWANLSAGGTVYRNDDCLNALPFCTSDSYTFPASTNVPDMGSVGCLYTTPNPAWYWMQIDQAGDIDIHISSGGDVDFIAWGPFNSLEEACATDLMSNSGVDCSYSTASTETANIDNAQPGEVYVLLITNYANIVTNISFNQTGGSGTTNCGIIAPPISNNGPICEGETLQLTVGTPDPSVSYSWTGPNGFTSSDMEPTITNVTTAHAGTYSLVITDGTDVSDPETTEVEIYPTPNPSASNTGPVCAGESVSVNALPTGMSSYSWTGPSGFSSSSQSFNIDTDSTGTDTGTYTLLVTDSNGCTAETTTDLTVHINPTMTVNGSNPLCFESCDGEIEINAQGGASPIEYFIDGGVSGQSSSVFSSLCAGTYSAMIQDGNGCLSNIYEVELIDPALLELSIVSIQNQNCQTPGSAEVIANGGTPPYNYNWPSNASGVNQGYAANLPVGNYTVTAVDANGCEAQVTFDIENEGELIVESMIESHVSCHGVSDGSIRVSISVGTPDYTINWGLDTEIVSESTYLIDNLSGGYYTITVTDFNGCTEIFNHHIDEPDRALGAIVTKENVSCYDANDGEIHASAYGGVTPYTFEWRLDDLISEQSSLTDISEGFYQLDIYDANACHFDTLIMIQEPSPILVDFEVSHPSCIGNDDGAIELSVSGGVGSYSYVWDNISSSVPYLTNLSEGTVEVMVVDSTNCSVDLGGITLIDVPEECIRIPDAFTPNGDDNNDTWIIENLERYPNAVVSVYNRWGQVVYSANQGEDPWDGTTLDGEKVATGSFLYLLKLYNGSKPISGIVTVVY